MASWKTIVAGTGIGATIIAAATYFSRLNKASKEIESVTTVRIHSLKLDGLTIRVDALIKNPTRTSITMKFPFVKLIYNDKTVGTSQTIDKDIVIPAYGEAHVDEILIKIPMLSLISVAAGLYKIISKSEPVNIFVRTISTIDLGWKKVAYEKTDNVTLHPQS